MLKALIIEDEQGTAGFINQVISDTCEEIAVAGIAGSVQAGIELIRQEEPDIVILDVELGDGTAFDLLQKTDYRSFILIFLTAYEGYALQAIKFSAFDYILKPFKPKELTDALNKAVKETNRENSLLSMQTLLNNLVATNKQDKKIILRAGSDIHLVKISDIVYCKADTSYTHFILTGGDKVTVSSNLKEYELLFHEYGFFRSHHSYLVNLQHICRFHKTGQAYLFLENGEQIPVSSRNKEKLSTLFKGI